MHIEAAGDYNKIWTYLIFAASSFHRLHKMKLVTLMMLFQ